MRNIRLFWQIFPTCVGITIASMLVVVWLATTTGHTFYIDRLKEEIRERLIKRGEEVGMPDLVDRIADETVGITEEEILQIIAYIKSLGAPAAASADAQPAH